MQDRLYPIARLQLPRIGNNLTRFGQRDSIATRQHCQRVQRVETAPHLLNGNPRCGSALPRRLLQPMLQVIDRLGPPFDVVQRLP